MSLDDSRTTRRQVPWAARARGVRLLALGAVGTGLALGLSGCIAQAIGGMAESFRLTGTRTVDAEYKGLEGKSVGVLVLADRGIEAEHVGLVPRLVAAISNRLVEAKVPSMAHRPDVLVHYMNNKPQWRAMSPGDMAADLAVDRLVLIELREYRLNEPGNAYIWDGVATGLVSVFEADVMLSDVAAFEKMISVKFPDHANAMTHEMGRNVVTSELSRRFAERVAWLFYEHEEANAITY